SFRRPMCSGSPRQSPAACAQTLPWHQETANTLPSGENATGTWSLAPQTKSIRNRSFPVAASQTRTDPFGRSSVGLIRVSDPARPADAPEEHVAGPVRERVQALAGRVREGGRGPGLLDQAADAREEQEFVPDEKGLRSGVEPRPDLPAGHVPHQRLEHVRVAA